MPAFFEWNFKDCRVTKRGKTQFCDKFFKIFNTNDIIILYLLSDFAPILTNIIHLVFFILLFLKKLSLIPNAHIGGALTALFIKKRLLTSNDAGFGKYIKPNLNIPISLLSIGDGGGCSSYSDSYRNVRSLLMDHQAHFFGTTAAPSDSSHDTTQPSTDCKYDSSTDARARTSRKQGRPSALRFPLSKCTCHARYHKIST